MRLDGLEKGFNDNARSRAVVMHSASYVSEGFIHKHGRLGRSWGCPALPVELSKEIIDLIKEGSCLYIYADDSKNFAQKVKERAKSYVDEMSSLMKTTWNYY